MSEGWGYLINARKWHYFGSDGRSLCGNWLKLALHNLETGNDDSPDNCRACRKKLLTRDSTYAIKGHQRNGS